MKFVVQYRLGVYHCWQTAGDVLTRYISTSGVRRLLEVGSHDGVEGTVSPCDTWAKFVQLYVAATLNVTLEDLFLADVAFVVPEVLITIHPFLPLCSRHGLDNVRLVLGFSQREITCANFVSN